MDQHRDQTPASDDEPAPATPDVAQPVSDPVAGPVRGRKAPVATGPDGGVLIRLSRRTAVVAGVLGLVIVVVTATGLGWPGWFATTTGLVVGFALIVGCAIAAALLLRTSASWTSLSTRTVRDSEGVRAVVGPPRPLHGSGSSVMQRRVPAQVVPIRSNAAPWVDGGVVLVHGRADGSMLQDGDVVQARWSVSRGPYLLERGDGLVFVAERSTLAAW